MREINFSLKSYDFSGNRPQVQMMNYMCYAASDNTFLNRSL